MKTCSAGIAGALAMGLTATPQVEARPITEEEAIALREEIARLKSRVEDLEKRLVESTEPAAPQAAEQPREEPRIEWKGSPRIVEGDRSFKAKGRIQADVNHVSAPSGLDDRGLGFSSEFRRIRLGGEGELGSGFGYKLEVEFSDNDVGLVDTFLTYRTGGWLLTLGNQNQFQSLDELVGDTTGSVMERAAFTDAFNFERRLGLAAEWQKGPWLVQGGLFTDDVNALSASNGDENNSYGVDGRLVFAPKLGGAQLHFGLSGHWRDLNSTGEAGVRYRQRPYSHVTDTRFLDTGTFKANSETHYGLEFAAVRGRWHVAAETHWLTAGRIGGADPTFFGGYAEVGYYLTPGDTRAYKNGIFDRSAPKNPVGQGGMGSWQLTLRYDYLDLNDRDIRGGTQNGYIAGLVWSPINYLRFNLNYAHLDYRDAVLYAGSRNDYGVNVVGLRAELDY